MASLDLDNLSDLEIRTKLIDLGQSIGPITSTTRNIYLKKLKSLLNQSHNSVDLNSSIKYDPANIPTPSSGEESDTGSSRTTRKSMPPPRSNKSPKRKSPTRANLNNPPLANSTFHEKETNSTYTSPRTVNFETIRAAQTPPSTSHFEARSTHSPPSTSHFEARRSTRSSTGSNHSFVDDESENDVSLSRNTRPIIKQSSSENYRVTDNTTNRASDIDQGLGLSEAFRSRLQASSSSSFTSNYASPRHNSSNEPFASDFARKLSTSRSAYSPNSSINSKLLDVKESDDEDTGSTPVYARFTQGGKASPTIRGRGRRIGSFNDSWLPFDSPISAVLLISFSLFFFILGVTYVNMHSADTSVGPQTDLHLPICEEMKSNAQPLINCIRDGDIDVATTLFKIAYAKIYEKLEGSPCNKIASGPFGMSDKEVLHSIQEHEQRIEPWLAERQLPNVKLLISANPQTKLADISGGIAIINPPESFTCYIMNNLLAVGSWLFKSILVVGVITALFYFGRAYFAREQSYKDNVFKLANNIIEIIASRSQVSDGCVPIIHVRDQLLHPQDRQRMEKLWNDAVDVINSDSRVRCEQRVVEGEDCLVWRWIATSYNPNKRKTWQGQAFDTMEGSVNSLPNSPTSCLKIRHMFDAALEEGDEWVGTVVDAILEKTKDARILHVAVERQSREGCVYMKCVSPTDAGIAYRALHGSWFDSKLVTVKYIREGRYLERFPESAKCTQPLHPSYENHN